jgi:hypothetical protein
MQLIWVLLIWDIFQKEGIPYFIEEYNKVIEFSIYFITG